MATYDPNRPRPTIDETAELPGDLRVPQSESAVADVSGGGATSGADTGADSEVDPPTGPVSRLLPRQAEPVDRRWLAALGAAVAIGWLAAALLTWWLWRRRRRH